ncbi:formate dehydrogenase N subunit beta transmembrane domain-containing protein, partial [Pseudomonas aeruginosa]
MHPQQHGALPAAAHGQGATVLAGFFHYVRVGPNRADDEEDH